MMNDSERWKSSYAIDVVPHEHFPEGAMVVTTVAAHTFQLYPHEARYLRHLLNAAPLDNARKADQLTSEQPPTKESAG
jgi:hypothetical protein